jgi:TolB-like protein
MTAFAAPAKSRTTIAILAFDYSGKDPSLDPLREGLAQMLISDASSLPNVQVVERARLKALIEEQKLARTGSVDPASAARVGKLLGARFLVLGSYFDLGQTMRLDARIVEVETGKIVRAVGATGNGADFWGIEQDLSKKINDAIASALPEMPKVDLPVRAKPPKLKSATVATYGRALLALDSGKKHEAKTLLTNVVQEAPGFQLAKTELNSLLQ